jgi:drug/metabolite transporter (DMT)-like permease
VDDGGMYLLLAIFSSAAIALILKFSETRDLNRYAVTTANYVAAFGLSVLFALMEDAGVMDPAVGFGRTVVLGVAGGILYFLGFIVIQKSIKENGVGITGAVSKIGIIVPVILSMLLWQEMPTAAQAVGILIALIAMIVANLSRDRGAAIAKGVKTILLLVFVIVGIAEFSNKIFEVYGRTELKSVYLSILFFTAFWISLLVTIHMNRKQGRRIRRDDVIVGMLVGVPNMLTSYFLIESLRTVKAAVAFPVYSSGSILLISLGGLLLFRERMRKQEVTAIGLIIIALILMY